MFSGDEMGDIDPSACTDRSCGVWKVGQEDNVNGFVGTVEMCGRDRERQGSQGGQGRQGGQGELEQHLTHTQSGT